MFAKFLKFHFLRKKLRRFLLFFLSASLFKLTPSNDPSDDLEIETVLLVDGIGFVSIESIDDEDGGAILGGRLIYLLTGIF